MSHRRDHYAVLGVARSATAAEIKAAFRRLAHEHHPDVNVTDPEADRRFRRVARAWEVLGDPARRRAYDERHTRGRFASPGGGGQQSFAVDSGPIYHMDLGHHSDFYQSGDPLTVREAAELVGRNPTWLRGAIRSGRLRADRDRSGYLLRRRDVERLDRTARRRRSRDDDQATAPEGAATTEAP